MSLYESTVHQLSTAKLRDDLAQFNDELASLAPSEQDQAYGVELQSAAAAAHAELVRRDEHSWDGMGNPYR